MKEIQGRIQLKGDTITNWETNDPQILENELIIVRHNDHVKFKLGELNSDNKEKKYSELPYILSSDVIRNSNPTTAGIGGISEGTNLKGLSVLDVLNKMLYPRVDPTIENLTITHSPTGIREYGTVCTFKNLTFTVKLGSLPITSIVLYKGNEQEDDNKLYESSIDEILALNTDGSITITYDFDDYTTNNAKSNIYSINITDADGVSMIEKNIQNGPTYVYPYYYGVIDSNTEVTESVIKGLTKKVETKGTKNYKYTANNQKMVFATLQSYGKIKTIKDPNGFNVTDTFTESTVTITGLDGTSQSYYVYTANSASTVTDFNMTFSH